MPIHQEGPSLPPSLWATTAAPGPASPLLAGPASADVAIVGGGFTGLSAALHLAEAGKAVVLVEAGEPGWGASGRNGGQVIPGWKILPEAMQARYGAERGARLARMSHAACDLVFELIERFAIACEAVRPGLVQAGFGERTRRLQAEWARQWRAYGVEVELLDRAGAAGLIGSEAYHYAMHDPRGGNLQPLSYARGLAAAAAGLGARLHGGTPAKAVERRGAGWRILTPEGRVDAEYLLVCTNGYTDALWPGLSRTVVPVPSFIIASTPLGDNAARGILPGGHAVTETRRVLFYFRLDPAGRFVFGGRGRLFDSVDRGPVGHLEAEARRLYPRLAGVNWEYAWGGLVALTPAHTPRLVRLAPGAFAGLGYNGRGIAMATMMGKQLALAVLGEDPDMVPEEPRGIPLHALRQIAISGRLLAGPFLDALDRRALR